MELIRGTCREENISLLIVSHWPQLAEQFSRVEHLDQFNQAVLTA